MTFYEFRHEDFNFGGFPYTGVRCMECNEIFSPGDLYSERLQGFYNDIPCLEVICGDCAADVLEEDFDRYLELWAE